MDVFQITAAEVKEITLKRYHIDSYFKIYVCVVYSISAFLWFLQKIFWCSFTPKKRVFLRSVTLESGYENPETKTSDDWFGPWTKYWECKSVSNQKRKKYNEMYLFPIFFHSSVHFEHHLSRFLTKKKNVFLKL